MILAAIITKLRTARYDLSILTREERQALVAAGQALNSL